MKGPGIPASPPESSGIGDRIEARFGRWWIQATAGCKCQELTARLNAMQPDQVRKWSELPELIFANVELLTGPVGLIVKALAAIAPGFCRKRIAAEIEQACRQADERPETRG